MLQSFLNVPEECVAVSYLDRGYVTLPTANRCAKSYKRFAAQQSITHVIYSLYPCPILGQPKSDYISYAILLNIFLLIMFLSNILLCTMFLFINYIPTPIGVYGPLLTATRAIYSYVTMNKFDHCRPALSCPQRVSYLQMATMNHHDDGSL